MACAKKCAAKGGSSKKTAKAPAKGTVPFGAQAACKGGKSKKCK